MLRTNGSGSRRPKTHTDPDPQHWVSARILKAATYLSAMGGFVEVPGRRVGVRHPGRIPPHNVEVGAGRHSGLGVPLHFSRA